MASHLLFLDFSGGEFLLIAVVFLMFFGSKSIPGIAKAIGKAMHEFRAAAGDVQREIQESANLNLKDIDINASSPSVKTPTLPPVVTPQLPQQKTEEKPQQDENKTVL